MENELSGTSKYENHIKRFHITLDIIPQVVETILDCGAKRGTFADIVKEKRPNINTTSIDLEPQEETVIKGSITEISFPDTSFDMVAAMEILEHLGDQDLQKATDEIFRVAKKYVLITVPYEEWPLNNVAGHKQFFTKKRLARIHEAKAVQVFDVLETSRYVGVRRFLLHKNPGLHAIYCRLFGDKKGTGPTWIGALFKL